MKGHPWTRVHRWLRASATHVRYHSLSIPSPAWGPYTAAMGRRHRGASPGAGSGASSFGSSIFGQGKGPAAGEGMEEMLKWR